MHVESAFQISKAFFIRITPQITPYIYPNINEAAKNLSFARFYLFILSKSFESFSLFS